MLFWNGLEELGRKEKNLEGVIRSLCLCDLYYLLVRACKRSDMLHPWIYARVREVEAKPNGHLDIWSREHYKSTTITFGKTIQDILIDPEVTVGIFSHTRPIAKAFLRMIMRELESNEVLHQAFPDVLWGKDTRQAQKWSEDDGIIVRRKSNPNEATVEAWGLVDGQPTSKHFQILLYDDIVVQASVTTPEMIDKTRTAFGTVVQPDQNGWRGEEVRGDSLALQRCLQDHHGSRDGYSSHSPWSDWWDGRRRTCAVV